MNTVKPWYLSKTIWGSLVAIAAALASALGMNIAQADQDTLSTALLQTVTVIGSITAVFGRLSATAEIE